MKRRTSSPSFRQGSVFAQSFDTVKLIVFSRPIPLMLGERNGFFAEQLISLDTTFTPNSVEQIRGILVGTWDLAHTAPDNVIAYDESEGADLAIFAGIDRGMKMALFVQPDIKSVKDLKGRTLGVDALTTGFAFVLRKMLLVNGLDPNKKDYQLTSVGGPPLRLEALKDGKIAGTLLTPPFDDQATRLGFVPLVATGDITDAYLASVWAGRRSWAVAHPHLMVRFLRAYVKAVDWAYDPANRDQAVAILARHEGITEEVAARRFDQEMDPTLAIIPKAGLDLEGLQNVINLRVEMGFLKPPIPPPEKYCDLTYHNRAIAPVG